jgi:hypothetical protein
MANSLSLGAQSVAGLGTFSYTVVTAGLYTLSCKTTLPYEQGTYNNSSVTPSVASAVQIVLSQTGSVSSSVTVGGSSQNPTPTQPSIGTSIRVNAAAGDVLSAVLSSANAIDSVPNMVKSNINLYQGY